MQDGEIPAPTSAFVEVTQLHSAYADAVNRRSWTALESLFVDDARVDVQVGTEAVEVRGAQALGEFIGGAIRDMTFFSFVPMTVHVFADVGASPTELRGRLYMCEHRQHRGRGHFDTVYGLYQDRFVLEEGRWRYQSRFWQPLNHEVPRRSFDISPPPEV